MAQTSRGGGSRHERAIPLSADTFLCDLLRAAGAPCYAAEGKDGDDIVARLAYELGPRSLILSADRDMFRYDFIRNAPDRVMADFYLRGDDPVLVALHPSPTGTPKDGVSFRTLKDVPTYEPDEWLHPHCKLHAVIHRPSHGYVRGACSPQTRRRGNLHGIARPLRLAAYALMGAMGEIHERYPEWDEAEDRVRWEEGEVEPHADSELRQMLVDGDKLAALRWLRDADDARRDGTDVDATREDGGNDFRAFARYAIVAELFAAIENDTTVLSNAREMRAATEATGHRGSRASSDWSDPFPPASRLALTCAACGGSYIVSAGEREFLKKKKYRLPRRCRACRDAGKEPAGKGRGVGTGEGNRPGAVVDEVANAASVLVPARANRPGAVVDEVADADESTRGIRIRRRRRSRLRGRLVPRRARDERRRRRSRTRWPRCERTTGRRGIARGRPTRA